MAQNETISPALAADVRAIVARIGTTAKLQGLEALVDKLRSEQSERWRMVVFTGRRETQSIIEEFLRERGISCGLINGDSGARNQQTIADFKIDPPGIHVIISTEAGSEGVNLQAANVVVNYDLPWNPMIVEQRIGRVQRLASAHKSVCVFNIILQGTFEEYIVGRLMEKLQMASHAVGDVEALLQAAGLNSEEGSEDFAEKIRKLVMASLAGKDVEAAARLAETSITEAKIELEREEENINAMLGGMNGAVNSGPRVPKLPPMVRSMNVRDFVHAAMSALGAKVLPDQASHVVFEINGERELAHFDQGQVAQGVPSILYAPGTVAFERLVSRMTSVGRHRVGDIDQDCISRSEELCQEWTKEFNGTFGSVRLEEVWRSFGGVALMRVRVTVAHDSYERLVEVPCITQDHRAKAGRSGLSPIVDPIEDPTSVGLSVEQLAAKAQMDPGIAEFCRFYQERLAEEIKATGEDTWKKKKIEEDFTPRFEIALVGLEGIVSRQLQMQVTYKIQGESEYSTTLTIVPSTKEILNRPEVGKCAKTGVVAPRECLGRCDASGLTVLKHLLVRSEVSGRMVTPEHIVICGLSGKKVVSDEAAISAVTGRPVTATLLKTSIVSGKRAEPEFFAPCEFTGVEVLDSELTISQVSNKRYRMDEQSRSDVSGKTGHRMEFIVCSETQQNLLSSEAEQCEVTGKFVRPGLLEKCEVTGKNVLPQELQRCAATGKRGLKKFFVTSSFSGAYLLETEAIRSLAGQFCSPLEGKPCLWSSRNCHPDDLRVCGLTGEAMHLEHMAGQMDNRQNVLIGLLAGTRRKVDGNQFWEPISVATSMLIGSNCRVESAELSPDKKHMAVCLEVRTWLGLKTRYAGLLYSMQDKAVIGRIALGKRSGNHWQIDMPQLMAA